MAYNHFYAKYPGYAGDSPIPHPLPCEFAASFFKEKKNGVFVDVGAHNGIAWSNTLIFEKLFGWTGLCIEPNPSVFEELQQNRDCVCLNAAIDVNTTKQTFWSIIGEGSGLCGLESGFIGDHISRIEEELAKHPESVCTQIQLTAQRLETVLADNDITHVDYLSIDVEGNEFGVLKSIDFQKCKCNLISVESNDRASVQSYLNSFGYKLLRKICADDFYCLG